MLGVYLKSIPPSCSHQVALPLSWGRGYESESENAMESAMGSESESGNGKESACDL